MYKKLIIICLGLISMSLSAQRVKIEGVVKDSIGNPLEYANVIAVNQETQGLDAYGITSDKGLYRLTVDANKSYEIKVTFLGFKPTSYVVEVKTEDITRDIVMEEDSNALDEVEVVYEMPVSIKGDTIVYNSDSFTNGTEKKLGDVLKKLPGVEVNADGEVEVEGKKVSKVMVEGKDFFDGDSKLATKNIPANALDKIEVLRNHSEVSAMSGVQDNSDNVALNIRLKEGKKNFWFGDLTAGGGMSSEDDGLYIVHPKLFYYSPEYSINIITDFNNIGAIPFTIRDYFNFSGGFRSVMRNGGTSFNTQANDLGLSFLTNNKAQNIESQFGAANFSLSPSKTWTLSGFGIYSGNSTDLATNAQTTYTESNEVEDRTTNTEQRTDLVLLKLSSSYKPSASVQFDYDALMKTSRQAEDERVVITATDPQDDDIISTNKEQKPFSLNQNLNYYNSTKEKHVFAFEAQHLWQDEDPFYNAIRTKQPFLGLPFDDTQSNYDINQEKRIKTNKLDAKFDYYYILNGKSNLNFTLGSTLSRQDFDSHIFQILDDGSSLDFNDPAANNDVQYNFSDLFLGVHYKFIAGKFTFNPGFTVHSYVGKNEQLGTTVKDELFNILPDAFIKVEFKKSQNLRLNYSMTREFTNVNQLAEGFIFNNFNSLFAGNRDLESSLYHNYSLNFFSFNMFNYTNIFGTINYSKKEDAIKNRAFIGGITQVSQPINSNLADETLTTLGRFGRTFGKFKGSLRASLSYSKFNNIIIDPITAEDVFRTSESLIQNYRVSAATTFNEAPNIEIGYDLTINDFDNVTNKNVFRTHSPFVKFDAAFLKHFTFIADYTFYNFTDKNNTVENQYSFVDTNLYYQKGESPWEFKLGITNLLNTKDINEASFNQFYNSTSSYRVQPRYVVFSVKYNL